MAPGNARARAAVDAAGGAGASVRPRRPQLPLRPVRSVQVLGRPAGRVSPSSALAWWGSSADPVSCGLVWVPNISPFGSQSGWRSKKQH